MQKKIGDPIENLWGIGSKTASKLKERGVDSFEKVASMDVSNLAEVLDRPVDELEIARELAQKIPHDFLRSVREYYLPIAWKTYGIGVDLGLFLYSIGVKDLSDIRYDKEITNRVLPERLDSQLQYLRPQTEIALVLGLSNKNARILVTKGGLRSLSDLAESSPRTIKRILGNVKLDRIQTWIELAGKMVEFGFRDYYVTGNLPLAKEIVGIGPETAAALYILGIKAKDDIAKLTAEDIEKYFPWLTMKKMEQMFKKVEWEKEIKKDIALTRTKAAKEGFIKPLFVQLAEYAKSLIEEMQATAPPITAPPEVTKDWDGITFVKPEKSLFPHPKKSTYKLNSDNGGVIIGNKCTHVMLASTLSRYLMEFGPAVAVGLIVEAAVSKVTKPGIGFAIGTTVSFFLGDLTDPMFYDEDSCIWVWLSNQHLATIPAVEAAVLLLIYFGQLPAAISILVGQWAVVGYLQISNLPTYQGLSLDIGRVCPWS